MKINLEKIINIRTKETNDYQSYFEKEDKLIIINNENKKDFFKQEVKIINSNEDFLIIRYKKYKIELLKDFCLQIILGHELITIYKDKSRISYKLKINEDFVRIGLEKTKENKNMSLNYQNNKKTNPSQFHRIDIDLFEGKDSSIKNLMNLKDYYDILQLQTDNTAPNVLNNISNKDGKLFNLFLNKIFPETKIKISNKIIN